MSSSLALFVDQIAPFTIGFVKIDSESPSSMGSGTLLQFGPISGILTCAHVAEAVMRETRIGILLFPTKIESLQTYIIATDVIDPLILGSPPWTELGPDIAYLKIPEVELSKFRARASFVNGSLHFERMLSGEPPDCQKLDVVAGVISDWTDSPTLAGRLATVPFNGLLNVGQAIRLVEQPLDLIEFLPSPEGGFELPDSFQGTSGGGLWRLYVKSNENGDFDLEQRRLIGVAFWETSKHPPTLICHAMQTLYGVLKTEIEKKWAE